MSSERGPRRLAEVALAWSIAAAVGCGVIGLVDALVSWGSFAQFAPSLMTRLRTAAYVAFLYGIAGSVGIAAIASFVVLLWRHTRLGALGRAAIEAHDQARLAGHENAVAGLALSIAASVIVPASLAGSFWLSYPYLSTRKHLGLLIATSMALALLALGVAAIATLLVGQVLELGLRKLAARSPLGSYLSHPLAPLAAAGVLGAGILIIILSATWSVSQHLPIRAPLCALGSLVATIACRPIGFRRLRAPDEQKPAVRRLLIGSRYLMALIAMLVLGASPATQKASAAYTGLSRPLSQSIRDLVDLDRDGFSALLGGGDCSDLNSAVHPGASDIPGDGIDQNCIGGDPSATPEAREQTFPAVPPSVPRENLSLILITIDTLRADHVGSYGYERKTTPNIDAVASEGAVFVNAWAHAPSTRYSMPAILTGRLPLSVYYDTSVRGWPGLLPRGDYIASLAKEAGRRTGAILNYWYFGRERGMDRDFDVYDNSNKRLHRGVPGEGPAQTKGSSSRQQTDKAIEFIEGSAGGPFFLWVHYYDPHFAYEKHSESPNFGSEPVDLYDNEIHFTDLHIGRLIQTLKTKGLYDSTALVITGDHGEGFGEHGVDLHGYHLYAAQTKVPLIVRVPGIAPSRPTSPVGHIDILPTIANLLQLAPRASFQGRSLLGPMTDQAKANEDRWVHQQLSFENDNEIRAAANSQCHIIFRVSPTSSWELYQIDKDPLEENDIIGDPGDCEPARKHLERWFDRSEIPEGAIEAVLSTPPAKLDLDIDFAGHARLRSVQAPARIERGQMFAITYTFEAKSPLSDHWKVFAHFEDGKGGRFTDDHSPTRPFSWWKEGQFIRYTRHVRVPKNARPGTYHLWIGIYRGSDRIPASSQEATVRDDRVQAASIEIR